MKIGSAALICVLLVAATSYASPWYSSRRIQRHQKDLPITTSKENEVEDQPPPMPEEELQGIMKMASNEDAKMTDDDLDKSLSNCNDFQLAELELEHQFCVTNADIIIHETLFTPFPLTGLCSSLATKFDCFREFVPKCYNETFLEKRLENFAFSRLQIAYNNSLIGESFVNSCPPLKGYESVLVPKISGGNVCSFKELNDDVNQRLDCYNKANRLQELRLQISEFLLVSGPSFVETVLFPAACTLKTEVEVCLDNVKCFIGEGLEAVRTNLYKDLRDQELILQTQFPELEFAYNTTCEVYEREMESLEKDKETIKDLQQDFFLPFFSQLFNPNGTDQPEITVIPPLPLPQ